MLYETVNEVKFLIIDNKAFYGFIGIEQTRIGTVKLERLRYKTNTK